MYRRSLICSLAACVVGATLAGCQQPGQNMPAMQDMKPPPRAPEMAHLDKWIGTWNGTSQFKMPGSDKTTSGTGQNTVTSVCDGRYVMEQMDGDMGDMGKMSMIGMYTWDPAKKKYRAWWFDSHGGAAEGWMTYNDQTKTWSMDASGHNPAMGMSTVGEGTMKLPDDNTMEWTWTEYEKTMFGKKKMMDITGTSTRG